MFQVCEMVFSLLLAAYAPRRGPARSPGRPARLAVRLAATEEVVAFAKKQASHLLHFHLGRPAEADAL